jgi:hypothetical protein
MTNLFDLETVEGIVAITLELSQELWIAGVCEVRALWANSVASLCRETMLSDYLIK